MTRMKWFFLGLVACSIIFSGCRNSTDEGPPPDVTIGALLDLSGPGKTLGKLSKDAIDYAVEQAASEGVNIRVRVADTASDPNRAQAYLQQFINEGIYYVVGPQTSSEARSITSLATRSGVLLVSQGSTASSIANQNDMLCRLVPTDVVESRAVFDLMRDQNINSFVLVGRNDTGNVGLLTSLTNYIKQARLPFRPAIKYDADSNVDFNKVVDQIELAVATASTAVARVGVFIAGYDEVSDLFDAASKSKYLFRSSLGYFGGDGSAQADSIVDNGTAADFASQSAFPSPLLTVPTESFSQAVAVTNAIGGGEPNAFALAAYDATILLQQVFQRNDRVLPLGDALLRSFQAVANGYHGASGTITLNEDCDRASGSYAFWGVCEVNNDYRWTRVGEWAPSASPTSAGTVRYLGCNGN